MQKLIIMVTRALWYLAPSCFFRCISCCSHHPPIHYTGINREAVELSDLLCFGSLHLHFPLLESSPSPPMPGSSSSFTPCRSIPGFSLIPQASLGPHHLAYSTLMPCFPACGNRGPWLIFDSFSICSTMLGT